jgi:tetratricopeptide (TPR) repeat protein
MTKDAQGHPVSGASAEAIALFDQGIRAFSLAYGDAIGNISAAITAAPDFAMAHLAKAWLFGLSRDPGMVARAAGIIETAAALKMNDREQSHLAALRQAVTGARGAAVALLDRHLMRYPFDILAHELALLLDLSLGRVRWMRDRTARSLPLWSADIPGHAALRSFHAFGLEENGDYARAEDQSRAVAEAEPDSYFAHHTVSHVLEMTGRPEDGLGWMAAREAHWNSASHPNRDHIWWHRALYHLELGQYAAALALYDGPFRASEKQLAISLTHASALLWRLDTLGVDVADRWQALLPRWDGHADGQCFVFADLHAVMAELRSGNEALAERRLATMRQTATNTDESAATYREVGLPLTEGLIAFHKGAYEEAVAHLLPARFDLWRIGGSAAQRDVFDWTVTEAAVRGGLRDVALTNERLGLRPRSHVNQRFRQRAEQIAA